MNRMYRHGEIDRYQIRTPEELYRYRMYRPEELYRYEIYTPEELDRYRTRRCNGYIS